jgi:hypothetical protein
MSRLLWLLLIAIVGCEQSEIPENAKHRLGEAGAIMKHVWYYTDGDECGETFPANGGFVEKIVGTKDGVLVAQGSGWNEATKTYSASTYLTGTIEGHPSTGRRRMTILPFCAAHEPPAVRPAADAACPVGAAYGA